MALPKTLGIFILLKLWEVVVHPLGLVVMWTLAAAGAVLWATWKVLTWTSLTLLVIAFGIWLGLQAKHCPKGEEWLYLWLSLPAWGAVIALVVRLCANLDEAENDKSKATPDWKFAWVGLRALGRFLFPRWLLTLGLACLTGFIMWLDFRGAPTWLKSLTTGSQPAPEWSVRMQATNAYAWGFIWRSEMNSPDGKPSYHGMDEFGSYPVYLARARPGAEEGDHHEFGFSEGRLSDLRPWRGWVVTASNVGPWYQHGRGPWWLATHEEATNVLRDVSNSLATEGVAEWRSWQRDTKSWIQQRPWVANNAVSPRRHFRSVVFDTEGPGRWAIILFALWLALAVVVASVRRYRKLKSLADWQTPLLILRPLRAWLAANWQQAQAIEAGKGEWPWLVEEKPEKAAAPAAKPTKRRKVKS